jgi:hypothetical protein
VKSSIFSSFSIPNHENVLTTLFSPWLMKMISRRLRELNGPIPSGILLQISYDQLQVYTIQNWSIEFLHPLDNHLIVHGENQCYKKVSSKRTWTSIMRVTYLDEEEFSTLPFLRASCFIQGLWDFNK